MNELFKLKKIKLTSQRKYIYNIIRDNPCSIKELIEQIRGIDKSTLYRTIDLFIEKSLFIKNVDNDGNIYYTINEEHTHYVDCIRCHKKTKIDFCPIDEIERHVYDDIGYTLVSHNMMLEGICKECKDINDINE